MPITEDDIPNVFVSVLLVKGRTTAPPPTRQRGDADVATDRRDRDPGKPAFRLGYVELKVEDRVEAADRRPCAPTRKSTVRRTRRTVQVDVKDASGRGAPSEVTLWAVDYGVLSLTGYRTPDVLGSVYVHKALQVMNADSRQRIVSRRVLTPKGETEGGGGGARRRRRHAAQGLPRARVLARLGDDRRVRARDGRRQAAGVADDLSHHGGRGRSQLAVRIGRQRGPHQQAADAEADVPALPRASATRRYFGAVVTSQLPTAGAATVTIKSLDPDVLEFTGARRADACTIARRRIDRSAVRRRRRSASAARACR